MTKVTSPRLPFATRRPFGRLASTAAAGATVAALAVGTAAHRPPSTHTFPAKAPVLAASVSAPIVGEAPLPAGGGYWVAYANGAVVAEGAATLHGDLSSVHLAAPIISITSTADGKGYWMLAADGGVFSFGDASFHGSTGNIRLNKPVVAMAATPSGQGYWLVASDGGVFAFGDAAFSGSTADIRLARPIVGLAPSGSGSGYWLVASDGGVFSFGDARFYGSTGNIRLDQPVVAMAATNDGHGYWLAGADGGVFAFGDAVFRGSAFGYLGSAHAVAIVTAGAGYWILSSAGAVYGYGAPAVPVASPPGSVPVSTSASPSPAPAPSGEPTTANTGVPAGVALLNLDSAPSQALPAANSSPAGCATWKRGSGLSTNQDGCTIKDVQYTGDFTIANNNTTLSGVRIIGPGTEASSNVIVKSDWGGPAYTGTVIENSDIHDGTSQGSMWCVAGFNFSLINDNIYGCTHDIQMWGGAENVSITGSYLHQPIAVSGDHVELLYAPPGTNHVTLEDDNWQIDPNGGGTTAALFLDGTNQDSNWTVSGNWFDGSSGTPSNWNSIQSDTSGIIFTNNRIGLKSTYGPYLFNSYPPSSSGGNVWMYSGTTPSSWSYEAGQRVTAGAELPGI